MYHIKPYLKSKGYNLSRLAKMMGMSFQKFDHHIREKEDLSFNFVIGISKILDVQLTDFIEIISTSKKANFKDNGQEIETNNTHHNDTKKS
jgi:plasmid maintenance system antidote protein VapI